MWPWGHLAVGYLLFSLYSRGRYRRAPDGLSAVVLVLATQMPDLIDKPLAYWFGVLPEGRSLAHSLLFVGPLVVVAGYVAWRIARPRLGSAFAIGSLSHLAGDSYAAFLAGKWDELSFLLWPVLPTPDYGEDSLSVHLVEMLSEVNSVSPDALLAGTASAFALQLVMAAFVGVVWLVDGMPGVGFLFRPFLRRSDPPR